MNARSLALLLVTLAVGAQTTAHAAKPSATDEQLSPLPPPALRDEIAAADSALFDAFNRRDLAKLMSLFTRDLEFYQDNEGVANYARTKKDFGQMFGQAAPIRRELVPGSLEVFPIKNYGAMEVGRHRFCHVENGRDECGTFSFVHIWRRTDRGWQIARAISYGH